MPAFPAESQASEGYEMRSTDWAQSELSRESSRSQRFPAEATGAAPWAVRPIPG